MQETPAADSSDTKAVLINVAEEQFGMYGLAGPSLREIGRLAGCANTGAVRYHFGNREGLVDAIFRTRLDLMEKHRAALLAAARSNDSEPDLPGLIEILYRPFEQQRGPSGKRSYAAFLAGLARSGETGIWGRYRKGLVATGQINADLAKHVPHISAERFEQRLRTISTMVWSRLAELDREGDARTEQENEAEFRDLVAMAAAALAAR